MTTPSRLAASLVLALALAGCNRTEAEPAPRQEAAAPASAATTAKGGVRFVPAPPGPDFAAVAKAEAARARADGRMLLVYVGASWCEPCQRFHAAAQRGELDGAFPNLTLLEADADADRERLAAAGYGAELIPLFALPSAEGRGTPRRIEGSIKGEGAVANITPRLRQLLGSAGR